jgi:hypothetical protein
MKRGYTKLKHRFYVDLPVSCEMLWFYHIISKVIKKQYQKNILKCSNIGPIYS